MITTIAATQFVFISLGILALNVLLKASGYAHNVASTFPALAVTLARNGLWMFIVPLAWVGFAALCERVQRFPLNASSARLSGMLLAAALLGIYVYAASAFFQT